MTNLYRYKRNSKIGKVSFSTIKKRFFNNRKEGICYNCNKGIMETTERGKITYDFL